MKAIAENTDGPSADETSVILGEGTFIFNDGSDSRIPSEDDHTDKHVGELLAYSFKENIANAPSIFPLEGGINFPSSSCDGTAHHQMRQDSSKAKTDVNLGVLCANNQQKQQDSAKSTIHVAESHRNFNEVEDNEHQSQIIEFLVSENLGQNGTSNVDKNDEIPEYLRLLQVAEKEYGDSNVPLDSKPDWLDLEKLRRGQKFAGEYYFGLVFAEMLSLMLLFLYKENLKPLIYTGKSDTPFKAFKRYLSTVVRVTSWYECDLWKETGAAHKNLRIVRDMHQAYRTLLNNSDPQELKEKCALKPPLWSNQSEKLKEDFRSLCPYAEKGMCPAMSDDAFLYFNQADMAGTQFGFVGLMIVYPSAFGAARASEEDLEGFVHLWRCIGYLLGIDDRYNFCAGDLATVRQRSRDFIEYKMKPKLYYMDSSWEHMYRCVVEGISYYVPGVNFKTSFLYLVRLLGLRSTHMESTMTYFQTFLYWITSIVMCYLLQFPPYRQFNNWLLKIAIKKACSPSPSWIREHQERVYSYQTNNIGGHYTRL